MAWPIVQRLLAAAMLITASPVLLACFVWVKLDSPGPFLFLQSRPGCEGRTFTIYKVRTMQSRSESGTALGTAVGDPRVTRPGRILRRTKLDELPQLWNIVRGDMCFVGPRPLPTALDVELRESIPGFELRYSVPPGLTNLGQVCVVDNALGDRLVADWAVRFEAELAYLKHKGFRYDLVVLGLTVAYFWRQTLRPSGRKTMPVCSGIQRSTPSAELTSTRVLRTPIANLGLQGTADQVERWVRDSVRTYVGVCPVHSVVTGVLDADHRAALQSAGMNTADGMPVVWMQRLLGHKAASRVYGPTLTLELLERAQAYGWRVAFYGGKPEVLDLLIDKLTSRFPSLRIVEAISPPFRRLTADEDIEIMDRLNGAQADLIFVGLGCPKQERWMAAHSPRVQGVMLGVGAAFDFHAGVLRQAPTFLQRMGLEWAFRVAMEPRRLWKRYAVTNSLFVILAGWQLCRHWLTRGSCTTAAPGSSATRPRGTMSRPRLSQRLRPLKLRRAA